MRAAFVLSRASRILGAIQIPNRTFFHRLHKPSILYPKTLAKTPIISRMGDSAPRVRVSSSVSGGKSNGEVDHFELSPPSVLKLQKGDITAWFVDGSTDAIVNAANERMLGGGGVDGAIHRAAGPQLREACANVPEVRPGVRCPTGEARITPAFRLPVARVIHTVGPIYDVDAQPEVSLRNAYRNSLRLAKENGIQYIAFPAISCGVFRYPLDEASKIAISTVKEFSNDFKEVKTPRKLRAVIQSQVPCLLRGDLTAVTQQHLIVHFVLFADDVYRAWLAAARELL